MKSPFALLLLFTIAAGLWGQTPALRTMTADEKKTGVYYAGPYKPVTDSGIKFLTRFDYSAGQKGTADAGVLVYIPMKIDQIDDTGNAATEYWGHVSTLPSDPVEGKPYPSEFYIVWTNGIVPTFKRGQTRVFVGHYDSPQEVTYTDPSTGAKIKRTIAYFISDFAGY